MQARFLAIHAAPSSLVLLINAPKSVQSRLELCHRAEVRWPYSPVAQAFKQELRPVVLPVFQPSIMGFSWLTLSLS